MSVEGLDWLVVVCGRQHTIQGTIQGYGVQLPLLCTWPMACSNHFCPVREESCQGSDRYTLVSAGSVDRSEFISPPFLFSLQSHIRHPTKAIHFLLSTLPRHGLDWSLDLNNFMSVLLAHFWSQPASSS